MTERRQLLILAILFDVLGYGIVHQIGMTSSHATILCRICNEQEVVINPADKWCHECDEGLCIDCEKHHSISKSSRHHVVISIDDYKKLPAEISQIYQHCDEHGKRFQMFCLRHDQLCCSVCIAKFHNNCTELHDIDDVVMNAKTSSLLETIDQSLGYSHQNIEIIIKDREQNLAEIKQQRIEIQDKIKQKRDQINTHFDKLETRLVKELDTAEQTITSQIGQLIGQLKEKRKIVNQLQHNLTLIKSHASDLQTFLGTKHLEKQAYQEDKYIKSLANDESLQNTVTILAINEKIADLTAISTFASVTIEKRPTSVSIQTTKDKQAQVMSAVRMLFMSIDDIKITLLGTFDLPKGKGLTYLTGCSIFPNGHIAFADCHFNQRIVITNNNGIAQSEISVSPSQPFDITCLDNRSVAITNYANSNIKKINTMSQTTTNTIKTTSLCYGITNRQGTLIYCERGKGIVRHQLDKESSNTIVRQDISRWTYVAINESSIYHTNNASHTVTCYKMNGDKVWEFEDTSILKYPRGVAVDKHSNVYVASNENNRIIAISSDGNKCRLLLNEKEGIKDPLGLAVDSERGNLVVTCYNGKVFVYKLSLQG